jgi:hypothetical protein
MAKQKNANSNFIAAVFIKSFYQGMALVANIEEELMLMNLLYLGLSLCPFYLFVGGVLTYRKLVVIGQSNNLKCREAFLINKQL